MDMEYINGWLVKYQREDDGWDWSISRDGIEHRYGWQAGDMQEVKKYVRTIILEDLADAA